MISKNFAMQHSFWANLTACIELTDEEFEVLFHDARVHYDFTVNASTEVGGFLYGHKNSRDFANDADADSKKIANTISVEERKLQLMIKAVEFDHEEKAFALRTRLTKILFELHDKSKEINKVLNPEDHGR